ncbi:hypothetical protein H8E77_16425 [bacterium]|nr:hypothetical protein [bacterium]
MGILIKVANLSEDKEIMLKLLRDNRPNLPPDYPFEKRYKWLYEDNPYGKAIAWIAIDDSSSEIAGFTAALPRKMSVLGKQMLCWNCADFSINKKYRTLGAAIKLRRAAKDGVDSGEMPFLYAHPNDRMLVVHQKVGHLVIGKMIRYAKPLKLNKKTGEVFGENILSKSVSAVGNPILRITSKEFFYKGKYESSTFKGIQFGEEFSDFYEKFRKQNKVSGVRSDEYLNWKYLENPLYEAQTHLIRMNDELVGYIIYSADNEVAQVREVCYLGRDNADKYLLASFLSYLRGQAVCSVSFVLLDSNPFIDTLKHFGFKLRTDVSSSVIAYTSSSSELAEIVLDGQNWFMTVGDRDG